MSMIQRERPGLRGVRAARNNETGSGCGDTGEQPASIDRMGVPKVMAVVAHLRGTFECGSLPQDGAYRPSSRCVRASRFFTFALVVAAALAGVVPMAEKAAAQVPPADALRIRVEALAIEPRVEGTAIADAWFLIRFYERRQFEPAWDSPGRLDGLLRALDGSDEHGLDPSDYHVELIRAHVEERRREAAVEPDIALDILATDAVARYAFHLRFGKVDPVEIEPGWNFSRTLLGVDAVNAVQSLIDAPDIA